MRLLWIFPILVLLYEGASARAQTNLPMFEVGGQRLVLRLNEGRFQVRARLKPNSEGGDFSIRPHLRVGLDLSLVWGDDLVRIDFRATSGERFEGGWMSDLESEDERVFSIRRVSMSVRPFRGVEVSVGGLRPIEGAASSFTTLPNSYIAGYRLQVVQEGTDLVLTGGFVRNDPSFAEFERLATFRELDYLQIALTQTIAQILAAGLEYQRLGEIHAARGAFRLRLSHWVPFLQAISTEGIVAVDANGRARGRVWVASLTSVLRDLLGGADLRAAFIFGYRDLEEEEIRLASRLFSGWSGRLAITAPDLFRVRNWFRIEAGVIGSLSFEDHRVWRTDFVMGLSL